MDVRKQVKSFLAEHVPTEEEPLAFIRARPDAGSAWIAYPEALGGPAARWMDDRSPFVEDAKTPSIVLTRG